MDKEYSLLTSTRYDPFLESCQWNDDHEGPQPIFLLPYHLDRLTSAAEEHEWLNVRSALSYSNLKNACKNAVCAEEQGSTAFKLRITVSKQGPDHIRVTATSVSSFSSDPTSLPASFNPLSHPEKTTSSPIRLYLDSEATTPSIFTRTKTTFRTVYDRAKRRNESVLNADSDILLYNQQGEIMETSIFNVAFYRNSQWITPAATSGCLCGVMRRWLLENGRIREDVNGVLTRDAIYEDEWFLLFNGVQGCRIGKLNR